MSFDTTLIRNGHVLDPANGTDQVQDVAIIDGKIAKDSNGCGVKQWVKFEFDGHMPLLGSSISIGYLEGLNCLEEYFWGRVCDRDLGNTP